MTAKPKASPLQTLDAIDEILADVATIIELSPRDQRVAENRYRRLQQHLERPASAFAQFIRSSTCLTYAQGSIATNTIIVSGTEDDRFDVDAIVEMMARAEWRPSEPLDLLEEALQGFPGAEKIVRKSRCIQLQFAFMHMDVTPLDRSAQIPVARAGQIFHAPDKGPAHRVDAAPQGFTDWYRAQVGQEQQDFAAALEGRRATFARHRLRVDALEEAELKRAEQIGLPPMIPARLDAQESVALELLKRHLNIVYDGKPLKRPPSIYLTKRTGDFGYCPEGLAAQLVGLAMSIGGDPRRHLTAGTRPREMNPNYPKDIITDRWPRAGADGVTDMRVLAETLEAFAAKLERAASSQLKEVVAIMAELFGERVGVEEQRVLRERYGRGAENGLLLSTGSGQVYAPSAPAIIRPREEGRLRVEPQPIPKNHFHCGLMKDEDE